MPRDIKVKTQRDSVIAGFRLDYSRAVALICNPAELQRLVKEEKSRDRSSLTTRESGSSDENAAKASSPVNKQLNFSKISLFILCLGSVVGLTGCSEADAVTFLYMMMPIVAIPALYLAGIIIMALFSGVIFVLGKIVRLAYWIFGKRNSPKNWFERFFDGPNEPSKRHHRHGIKEDPYRKYLEKTSAIPTPRRMIPMFSIL